MSVATQNVVTAEELLRMPDDGWRYELVRGEVRKMAPAGGPHGAVAMRVGGALEHYARANNLGIVFAAETGFKISSDPDTVRAPDVAFVSRERIERIGIPPGYWPGAPDLVAEVVSPSDSYTDVQEKVVDWLSAGVLVVIVVDASKRRVSVHRAHEAKLLTENDVLSGEEVVPGWSLAVKDLFA